MRFLSNKKSVAFGGLAVKSPEDIEKEKAMKNDIEKDAGFRDPELSNEFVSMPSSNFES